MLQRNEITQYNSHITQQTGKKNTRNPFKGIQIRCQEKKKKTQTKLQRQMKTIRGTVVTKMTNNNPT
jgi:hypothetical protein